MRLPREASGLITYILIANNQHHHTHLTYKILNHATSLAPLNSFHIMKIKKNSASTIRCLSVCVEFSSLKTGQKTSQQGPATPSNKKKMTMTMTLRKDSCIPNLSKNSSCSRFLVYRHSPVDLLKRPEFQKADLARSPWRCPCHVSNSAIELPNVAHPPDDFWKVWMSFLVSLELHHVTRFFGMIYGTFRKRM